MMKKRKTTTQPSTPCFHSRPVLTLKATLIWPAYFLFFLMLFVPTTYQPIKAVLLAGVLMGIGINALIRGRLHLHRTILLWTLIMVVTGLGFMTLGAVNGGPGALRVGTVLVLWPLVYTVLITGIDSKHVVDGVFRIMVFSLIAISLYSIYYLLYAAGLLPSALYFEINMGQAVGFYNGYVEYNLYNISTLNFLVPFLIAMLIVWPKNSDLPVARLWIWLACILGLTVSILSGRRAVWLVMMISPFIVLLARLCMSKHFRLANAKRYKRMLLSLMVILSILFLIGAYVVDLDIGAIWGRLQAGFDFSGAGESARAEQFVALLQGWAQNPLFGAGCGTSVAGSLRSVNMPWAYELSYVAQLFHTGLIGFSIYASGVIWIFWMGIKVMRSNHWLGLYMLPALVGTACFLIANATNPYLGKFDYIWVIFLPIALINIWLLDKNKMAHNQGKS